MSAELDNEVIDELLVDEEEIDLSGVYSFNKNFSFVGKYNYSFSNSRSNVEDLIDTMFGIELNSCCYALKVVVRNYWTGIKKDNVLFFECLHWVIITPIIIVIARFFF